MTHIGKPIAYHKDMAVNKAKVPGLRHKPIKNWLFRFRDLFHFLLHK